MRSHFLCHLSSYHPFHWGFVIESSIGPRQIAIDFINYAHLSLVWLCNTWTKDSCVSSSSTVCSLSCSYLSADEPTWSLSSLLHFQGSFSVTIINFHLSTSVFSWSAPAFSTTSFCLGLSFSPFLPETGETPTAQTIFCCSHPQKPWQL